MIRRVQDDLADAARWFNFVDAVRLDRRRFGRTLQTRKTIFESIDVVVRYRNFRWKAARARRTQRTKILWRQERPILTMGCRSEPFAKQRVVTKLRHLSPDRSGREPLPCPRLQTYKRSCSAHLRA